MDAGRFREVLIFVLGTLTELRLEGFVECTDGSDKLTAKGMDEFMRLKRDGFEASEAEIHAAVAWYKTYDDGDESEKAEQP